LEHYCPFFTNSHSSNRLLRTTLPKINRPMKEKPLAPNHGWGAHPPSTLRRVRSSPQDRPHSLPLRLPLPLSLRLQVQSSGCPIHRALLFSLMTSFTSCLDTWFTLPRRAKRARECIGWHGKRWTFTSSE